MHELSIGMELVRVGSERAAGRKVRRVVVEIGRLTCVMPDALSFCFDLCAQGTELEGAALEIVRVPGRAKCTACGATVELETPVGKCACGSGALEWIAGEELRLREMEVEDVRDLRV